MTRAQEETVERVALTHGGAQVLPLDGTDDVVVIGYADDVERCHLRVPPHGHARAATQEDIRRAEARARAI